MAKWCGGMECKLEYSTVDVTCAPHTEIRYCFGMMQPLHLLEERAKCLKASTDLSVQDLT